MATTTGFKIQCPSCEAMVTIKNASLIGKKIDCPKCKYRFAVEAPGEIDEETGAVLKGRKQAGGTAIAKKGKAKSQTDDDEDDDDEAPPKKKSNTILFVGVGIVVLTLGLVAAAYFGGVFGEDDKPAPPQTGGSTTPGTKGSGTGPGTGPSGTENKGGNEPAVANNGKATPRTELTNLLPNDSQWVADVDVPRRLGHASRHSSLPPDKQTGPLIKGTLAWMSIRLPVPSVLAVATVRGRSRWFRPRVPSPRRSTQGGDGTGRSNRHHHESGLLPGQGQPGL